MAITRLLTAKRKNGWTFGFENDIDFYGLCGCAEPNKLDLVMVMRVLSKMKDMGLSSINDFEATYLNIISEAKKLKKFQWTSFIPLNFASSDDIHFGQITLFGVTFRFHGADYVEKQIRKSDLDSLIERIRIATQWKLRDLPTCWLTCRTSNVDFFQSWKDIDLSLYALRSLIELSARAFTFKTSYPLFHPRFNLPFPLFVIGTSDTGRREFNYFRKLYDETMEKTFEINSNAWRVVINNARKLRRPLKDNSTELLLAHCLKAYSQSIDEIEENRCLLSLWQMAESLTLSQNFGGKTQEVCARLAGFSSIMKNVDSSMLMDALSVIADNRNEIVHAGKNSRVSQEMLNILQWVCNTGLLWFINNMRFFKTFNDLELYYQYRTKNESMIKSLKNIIGLIKKERKTNKLSSSK